jgi:hypothetical protein
MIQFSRGQLEDVNFDVSDLKFNLENIWFNFQYYYNLKHVVITKLTINLNVYKRSSQ